MKDPDIELQIIAPPLQPDECKVYNAADSSSSSEEDNSGGATNIRQCEQAVTQMILPTDCKNTEQNDKMAAILSGMDSQFGMVVDPLCEVEGGVMFWYAKLVTDQIATVKAQADVILAVFANPPYNFGEINLDLGEAEAGALPGVERRKRSAPILKKRSRLRVVDQQTDDGGLLSLSTAPGKSYTRSYSYFSASGEGVVIYMVDTGLTILPEFQDVSIRWLYAIGAEQRESDENIPPSGNKALYQDGTCVASKMVGRFNGVVKNAELVVVKTKPNLISFFSAIALIIKDIRATLGPGSAARGRVVVNIKGGYKPVTVEDSILVQVMQRQFRELVVLIQAIVVVSAGEIVPGSPGSRLRKIDRRIDTYPALYYIDFFIFTVGAVVASAGNLRIGKSWPWSKGEPVDGISAELFAPGDGYCVNRAGVEKFAAGQGISTAIISGLAAYFLSLEDLSQQFKSHDNLPRALLQFMQSLGYSRAEWGPLSVWNGIDSTEEAKFFNEWVGPEGGFPPR